MIELWQLPLLFLVGTTAGFVDSIAGGGGLIALPTLLSCGLDPRVALGTSKLQSSFGSGSAAFHYAHAGTVDLKDCKRAFIFAAIGAALGTLTVQRIDPQFLSRFMPILLGAVAFYTLLKPELGSADAHARMSRFAFEATFIFGIAYYDGFFGPGAGTFWTMAFVLMTGFNLTRATGYTKVVNFGSNLSSLAFFLAAGQVHLVAGLAMGAGQLLGARVGSRMVVKRGTKFIRPIFITVVLALTAKLLYGAFVKK